MADVIKYSRIALGRAIQDLGSGSPSHGYEQLFGSTSPADVKGILQKILAGSPATLVPIDGPTLRGSDIHISPTIACMDSQTAPLYDHPSFLKNVCRSSSHEAPSFAVYVQPTPYIVICEPFWRQPILPPIPTPKTKHLICPAWNPYMQQIDPRGPWERDIFGYQVFSLIHEFVRFYEHQSRGMFTIPKEAYEWQDMIRLSPAQKRVNPMNYEAYVASKSAFGRFILCRSWDMWLTRLDLTVVYSDCQLDKSAELLPEHLNSGPKRLSPPQRSMSMRFLDHWS